VSLVTIFQSNEWRTASHAEIAGPCMRLYIGLEGPGDVIADFEAALAACERKECRVAS
jgi:cystathionine beta-lyase/cystathionine gamma-synthase